MTARRVAILSPGGPFLDDVLALVRRRSLNVDAVVVYLPSVAAELRKTPSGVARMKAIVRAPVRWARLRVRQRAIARAATGPWSVVRTSALNGVRLKRDLRRLSVDVLVLGRTGLVDAETLAIPREGVVNVHPGLLPWIRGNSPVANSLLRGVPLGATAFRVDEGIDTGAILSRRLVRLAGSETVPEARAALVRLWVEMTVDVIERAIAGPLPTPDPQSARYPICRTLDHPSDVAAMEDAVRRGEAKALLDRWSPLCEPRTLSLPPDADVSPVAPAAV